MGSRVDVIAEVTLRSAAELAGLVQRRELSPVEVARGFLDRIDRLDPALGAFQSVRTEAALHEAQALETRADLEHLPLAGVPVAIKDNVNLAGEPTRHGSAATSSVAARDDDALVQRLRRAGAVVIGKTRMPELALWPFTESQAFGPTRNPWNHDRTPGGSTGGGAAAVAARLAPLALGSDGGGSIRIPAACCGIVGIKPGPGIVPLAGGLETHWYGMSEFGPLANTVADAGLMLDVLAETNAYRAANLAGETLRIAISTTFPALGGRVSREVKAVVEKTAACLGGAGHRVEEADPPYSTSMALGFTRRWLSGVAADTAAIVEDEGQLEARTRAIARVGRWLQRRGLATPASDDAFGSQVDRWFSTHDVLLMPTLSTPAVPVGQWQGKGGLRTMLGAAGWILTPPWNLARVPALSVPAGMSAEGLPIGVQLVGPRGSERRLLGLAAQLEALQPWPRWTGADATGGSPSPFPPHSGR